MTLDRARRRAVTAGPEAPVALVALMMLVATLTTGCLPDQVDGRQERVAAQPALDLSWAEEASAPEIVDAGLVAMSQIGSVRLRQDAENPAEGDPVVSKDLRLAIGDGLGEATDGDCTGTLQLPSWGEPAALVVEDDLGAFRGDEAFWLSFGGDLGDLPDVRERLADEYADAWTTTPGLGMLCDFGEFLGPVSDLVGDEDLVKAGLGDVAGVPAVRVRTMSKQRTVTAWVQVDEPHLVLQVAVELRGRGNADASLTTVTTFSEVDAAVDVDFPAPEEIRAFMLPIG